jgi:hypothetical protein
LGSSRGIGGRRIQLEIRGCGGLGTTKDIENGTRIHPRDPEGFHLSIYQGSWSLNSKSRFPYLYGIGEDSAGDRADAARARTTRFM